MTYLHKDISGNVIDLEVGKAVCIGRNYMDHINELGNAVPTSPLLFMKPKTAFCDFSSPFPIPQHQGECHNELEIALLLKSKLTNASSNDVLAAIWGVGLGLDLTLRDVQQSLKEKGQPWERAKAFDASCPVSNFVPIEQFSDLQDLHFWLDINGERRQTGHTALMLTNIVEMLCAMSRAFTLLPGDVVLTGTPKGVGPLCAGDSIDASLVDFMTLSTSVIKE